MDEQNPRPAVEVPAPRKHRRYNGLVRKTNRARPAEGISQDSRVPDEVRDASELLKVVGDLTRMRLLCALLPGEGLSVGSCSGPWA